MLEKIGLPAKPSMRGSNWVVDASHCQGCSSQFSFINRKHHCRRCGGIFCSGCTGQRMVLRGQGDLPVRICEPCKKLEEAARFELRYGHRSRASRGGTAKLASKNEDDILSEILGNNEGKEPSPNASIETASSSSSCSTSREVAPSGEGGVDGDGLESTSPEELRQQAAEEKKRYKVLKGEGKSDEALKAFKRGKELERQANALEITLRKNRRRTFTSADPADGTKELGGRSNHKVVEEKDDLMAELRKLGWSDFDSRDKKAENMSIEGELSSLMGETSHDTVKHRGLGGIDKSQVVAHKRKALALKREGNLAEAKEELKKAKILEKELEEQELLGAGEESDDEISALIRNMDDGRKDELLGYDLDHGLDLNQLVGTVGNIGGDADVEVTDEDLLDPEIVASLRTLGWTDDFSIPEDNVGLSLSMDREALSSEILSLKREALSKKRAGNAAEAMALLKKAKLLEKDLGSLESGAVNVVAQNINKVDNGLTYQTYEAKNKKGSNPAPKNRLTIQKELLALKKKALALRREGRMDESEEALKQCSILELQLDEVGSALKVKATHPTIAIDQADHGSESQDGEVDVTDQDLQDPAYLSLLKTLGWNDEDNDVASLPLKPSKKDANLAVKTALPSVTEVVSSLPAKRPRRSKAEIQRELLGLKRNSLALRRQGKIDEAEEVLKAAKVLEAEIAELDAPQKVIEGESSSLMGAVIKSADGADDEDEVTEEDMRDPVMISMLENLGWKNEEVEAPEKVPAPTRRSKREIQQELLGLKRKALAHRRKGEVEEAEELMRKAQVLEAQLEEIDGKSNKSGSELPSHQEKPGTGRSMVDLSEQSTTTSANQDKQAADVLFMDSGRKEIDSTTPPSTRRDDSYSASSSQNIGTNILAESRHFDNMPKKLDENSAPPRQPVSDIIDLVTGDGKGGSNFPASRQDTAKFNNESHLESGKQKTSANPNLPSSKQTSSAKIPSVVDENSLQQEVLARKRKAVALKREGRLAEAREELRQAKLLEKTMGDESRVPETAPAAPITAPIIQQKEPSPSKSAVKPLSSRDRRKLQQESLSHKRQALKLRREGRTEEAEAELEMAKALEAQLEETASQDPGNPSASESDAMDVAVEDFLDPQLLSALKAIGVVDTSLVRQVPERPKAPSQPEPAKVSPGKGDNAGQERIRLEERIKAEKVKAVSLKRSGQQAEALEALRRAKLLEKKLNEHGSG